MAISLYKIKKWAKMLSGNSALHVCQGEGKCYAVDEIKGYYNDLTDKVVLFGFPHGQIPKYPNEKGHLNEFSIGIFQYGLACYDLYLMNADKRMLEDALLCADWALQHQDESGAWDTFGLEFPEAPYSSMAQGEAISLLCRAYLTSHDDRYIEGARKAFGFLCTPRSEGGVCEYCENSMYLYEFTNRPIVLNGAIFSYWGIRDFYLLTHEADVEKKMEMAEKGLNSIVANFDNEYWSMYDIENRIASPFYHKLHIAQLKAMYKLTGRQTYLILAEKFKKYDESFINRVRAFTKKALQKLSE